MLASSSTLTALLAARERASGGAVNEQAWAATTCAWSTPTAVTPCASTRCRRPSPRIGTRAPSRRWSAPPSAPPRPAPWTRWIGALCRRERVVHVDAAHAGSATICPELRASSTGSSTPTALHQLLHCGIATPVLRRKMGVCIPDLWRFPPPAARASSCSAPAGPARPRCSNSGSRMRSTSICSTMPCTWSCWRGRNGCGT